MDSHAESLEFTSRQTPSYVIEEGLHTGLASALTTDSSHIRPVSEDMRADDHTEEDRADEAALIG